jgi:hypothetical protein
MRSSIATFVRRVSKITLAAFGLAAWLAAAQVGQAAYGVSVNQEGDTLYIVGDENANTVSIIGADDEPHGKVGVFVVDVPWVYEGVNHIHVDLGGGDNFLGMDRINILGTLTVLTGDGDDVLDLGGWGYGASAIGGDIAISTAGGRDNVRIEDTSVYASVTIDTADGSDIVQLGYDYFFFSIGASPAPGRTAGEDSFRADDSGRDDSPSDLSALTDDDGRSDLIALPDDGPSDGPSDGDDAKLVLRLAYLAGPSNVFESLYVFTGDGRDMVGITGAQIDVETTIELGSDDDRLILDAPNEFYGDFTARGEQGSDYLSDEPTNFYESAPQFQSFEQP